MIYLYWYLGIGVAVLAVVFGAHRLTKNDEPESLSDLDAVIPDRKMRSYRILNNAVILVLAAVALVVVWPAAVYMKAKGFFGGKGEAALDEQREFAVERGHLQERLTVQQIEAREIVTDPLGAVPDLPFGHLNAAWKTLISTAGVGDEVWSFTAQWQPTWGRKEVRAGYIIVRDGSPAAHMLTLLKEIEEDPEGAQGSDAPAADASKRAPRSLSGFPAFPQRGSDQTIRASPAS